MKKLNICIAGIGNVGSELIKSIEENKSYYEKKSSFQFNIIGISAKNKNKNRNVDINNYRCLN